MVTLSDSTGYMMEVCVIIIALTIFILSQAATHTSEWSYYLK